MLVHTKVTFERDDFFVKMETLVMGVKKYIGGLVSLGQDFEQIDMYLVTVTR